MGGLKAPERIKLIIGEQLCQIQSMQDQIAERDEKIAALQDQVKERDAKIWQLENRGT